MKWEQGLGRPLASAGEPCSMNRLAAAIAGLCLLAAPAHAGTASSEPRRTGPWIPTTAGLPSPLAQECETSTSEWSDGRAAMDTETCEWWFQYAPAAEADTARDYGILWLQTTSTPRKGFCIDKSIAMHQAGSPFEPLRAVSARRLEVRRARDVVVRLATDADGHGPVPATVEQDVRVKPGNLRVSALSDEGAVTASWRPSPTARGAVTLVVGIEVSWDGGLEGAVDLYETRTDLRTFFSRC